MKVIRVRKSDRVIRGTISLPSSKSISNRLLIIRTLTDQEFPISNLSESDDTVLLGKLLETIRLSTGIQYPIELDAGNAGTVFRFLTGLLACTPGNWILTGTERMHQRPIGILTEALIRLGSSIHYLQTAGFPPIHIYGKELFGGDLVVDAGVSSQFLSSLLMIAPKIKNGLTLKLTGQKVSSPYVDMTIGLMADFGVPVKTIDNLLVVPETNYHPVNFTVESDWSSAAFWYEAAALSDETDLHLTGLKRDGLQGDKILAEIFENFGVETKFLENGIRLKKSGLRNTQCTFDFSDHPDIAPSVITSCALLGMNGRFSGVKSLRIKETDRLLALQTELARLGVLLHVSSADDLVVGHDPAFSMSPLASYPRFKTYDDHRIAMAMAMLAVRYGEVKIESPEAVTKSYPGFWNDLKRTGFELF